MSTYRGYMPWKTNLSTTSYSSKANSGSRYPSRDELPDTKSTPRFSTITSPSTYRPAYSGGTYRSIGIKRDNPISTTTPSPTSYSNKYSSSTVASPPSASIKESAKDTNSLLRKPNSRYGSAKDVAQESPIKSTSTTPRYLSTGNLTSTKSKLKEPNVIDITTSPSSSASSSNTKSNLIQRRPALNISRVRSRDPSPIHNNTTYGGNSIRSRDPSPAEPSKLKDRYGSSLSSTNGYSTSSAYRLFPRANASSSASSTTPSSSTPSSYSKYGSGNNVRNPGTALSYMTASDATARCVKRRIEKEEKSTVKENVKERDGGVDKTENNNNSEKIKFIQVSVVSRATSPSPQISSSNSSLSLSTNYLRSRRLEIAKTIEKIIDRPVQKPQCEDKEIQSDRLDDSTKYSRFCSTSTSSSSSSSSPSSPSVSSAPVSATNSRSTPSWSSYLDSRNLSRCDNNSSSSNTNLSSNKTESTDLSDKKLSKSKENSPSKNNQQNKIVSTTKNNIKQDKIKTTSSSPSAASASSSTSSVSSMSSKLQKQKLSSSSSSNTSLNNAPISTKSKLPPLAPQKSESPMKVTSSSSPSATANSVNGGSTNGNNNHYKWTNKDFRKSALNVGPTDRPRKSRNSSIESETDVIGVEKCNSPVLRRTERSPSASSELSNSSNTTATTANSSSTANTASSSDDDTRNKIHKNSSRTSLLISTNDELPYDNSKSISYQQIINSSNTTTNTNNNTSSLNELIPAPTSSTTTTTTTTTTNNLETTATIPPTNSKTDDAKSFLIRTLGSVTNLFKVKSQPEVISTNTNNNNNIINNTNTNNTTNVANAEYFDNNSFSISENLQQDTNEILPFDNPILITNNKTNNLNESITANTIDNNKSNKSSENCWQNSSETNNYSDNSKDEFGINMQFKLRHIDSGELPWWMNNDDSNNGADGGAGSIENNNDNDDTIAEDITLAQSELNDISLCSYDNYNKLNRNDSGDHDWWLTQNNNNNNNNNNDDGNNSNSANNVKELSENSINTENSKNSKDSSTNSKYRISHIKSGERAWWLINENDCENVSAPNNNSMSNNNMNTNTNNKNNNDHNNKDELNKFHKLRHNYSGDKAWWMTSNETSSSDNKTNNINSDINDNKIKYKIGHVDSGEKAWWLKSDNDNDDDDDGNDEDDNDCANDNEINRIEQCDYNKNNNIKNYKSNNHEEQIKSLSPLGDRASPEGLEDTEMNKEFVNLRKSSNINSHHNKKSGKKLFISRHTNIDDLLGGSCHSLSPLLLERFTVKDQYEEISPSQVRIHDSTAKIPVIQRITNDRDENSRDQWDYSAKVLDDACLQVYKDGDFGAYLDLESSLAEQTEEIEGLNTSRKNSLVVRTQLSVRVHAIIDKLRTSQGRDLRHALFSLKQIFQEDKDLVHGFVGLGGLNCLVQVGRNADQNYQNYILRALGQVMLYVDGMNGVMKHGPTIQWLYSLIASKYRLVVKTALKLLLVFVEYIESNCYLLVRAVHEVDNGPGTLPWTNIMKLLKDYESADTELLIYATSLINKTLSGLSDQDSFYDESDFLEQQGMEGVVQRYMSRQGTDLDLLDQLQLYEAVLKFEDGETDGIRISSDSSVRKTLRYRSNNVNPLDPMERRKSRRHSTGNSPINSQQQPAPPPPPPLPPQSLTNYNNSHQIYQTVDEDSSSSGNSGELNDVFGVAGTATTSTSTNGTSTTAGTKTGAGVTPGLRRRRERAERTKTFLREQQEAAAAVGNGVTNRIDDGQESENEDKKLLLQLKRDHTVKDLTHKLRNLPMSPQDEKPQSRIGDMSGLISKAKEGLAKSKSKGDISRSPSIDQEIKKVEPKKSENELHWEELVKNLSRPLKLCDVDFTDLNVDDDTDGLPSRGLGGAVPPPPPPIGIPPPMMNLPPPPTNLVPPPCFLNGPKFNSNNGNDLNGSTIKKNKKTVKLFWKEVRDDMIPPTIVAKTIWDELPKSDVDTKKLEELFESRAKDLHTKEKQQELNKSKEIIVLDHKRSNAINIAMTKLPPPRAIKAAILKMDATVVTREGIDKLLNMLPTDEERGKIQEAQMQNPELPLGSAEQFLLTLGTISELSARLRLWAFKLDFENSEKEIVDPLNDLKQGIELLKNNKTFKCILSTLLSIGIFLNGAPVKGFQIEYLSKVPEVKDTVQKHSLLHHLCHMVMETSPATTDLYSEIGAITRASKADFTDLAHNINYLETECKASWDRLKLIAKHDCPAQLNQKLVDFLADCAERIITLDIVHRRVINRYRKFLLWLGVPQHRIIESRPNEICRIISEFALEYRTTRERVQQQIEKKANHRERNKTRGKMIIDVAKFRSQEDRADAELRQLLGSPKTVDNVENAGTFTWRRRRAENLASPGGINSSSHGTHGGGNFSGNNYGNGFKQTEENFTDGDDEILESLVKTATKTSGARPTPRERKRTRHADRKSLVKRSRTREGFTVDRSAIHLNNNNNNNNNDK